MAVLVALQARVSIGTATAWAVEKSPSETLPPGARVEAKMVALEVGTTVVVQEVWRDRVWCARPFVVVHHEAEMSAMWMPAGTVFKGPSNPTDRPLKPTPRERMLDNLRYADWRYRDVLAQMSSL